MKSNQQTLERRMYKRFRAKEGAAAILKKDHLTLLGPIIDISKGGLAFRYIENKKRINGFSELDILFAAGNFYLSGLAFKTVSDFIMPKKPFSIITMRRRSVKFGKLTPDQISQLEYFIQNHTVGEV
jgi:hypothetical protein